MGCTPKTVATPEAGTTDGGGTGDGGAGSGSDAGQGAPDAGPITTDLKVHVRGPGASGVEYHVMLGSDATTTRQGKTLSGDITFNAVTLPQDVTVISSRGGKATVNTVLGVAKSEVTFLWITPPSGGSGQLAGTLPNYTSSADDYQVAAYFFPRGRERTGNVVLPSRTWSMETSYSGELWLGAYEQRGSGLFASPQKAGLVRTGLTLSPGGRLDPADVALTHPFDNSLSVKIKNAGDFAGGFFGGSVSYTFQNGAVPVTVSFPALGIFGGASGKLPAVARTPPFHDCTYGILLGTQGNAGETSIAIRNGIAALTEVPEVSILPFTTFVSPTPARSTEIAFSWTAPKVNTAEVLLFSDGATGSIDPSETFVGNKDATFTWMVSAKPSGAGAFKPFKLPVAAGVPTSVPATSSGCPTSGFRVGCYGTFLFAIDDPNLTFDDVVAGRLDTTRITEIPDGRVSLVQSKLEVR